MLSASLEHFVEVWKNYKRNQFAGEHTSVLLVGNVVEFVHKNAISEGFQKDK